MLGEFVVVRSIRAIEPALGGSALHWFSQLASCLVNGKDVVRRSHSMPYPYGCWETGCWLTWFIVGFGSICRGYRTGCTLKVLLNLHRILFPVFLIQFFLFINQLYCIYLSVCKPYSGFIHILPCARFLATVLVGRQQMRFECVMFICMYGWLCIYACMRLLPNSSIFSLFWKVGFENTD